MLTRVGAVALPTFTEDASPISVIQCRVCGGMGYYVGPDEQGREMAHRCPECSKAKLAKGNGGIPPHYAGVSWTTWEPRPEVAELVDRLRLWSGMPWGVVLVSEGRANLGAGKTRVLCTLVAEWRAAGRRARYLAVTEMIAKQRAWMDEQTDRDDGTARWCSEYTGLLALDDLGAEHDDRAGFHASLVEEVLDSRFRNEFPTAVATNLNGVSLAKRYPRAWRRLREEGEVMPWVCLSFLGARGGAR